MTIRPNSQVSRLLRVLADGEWHSRTEIVQNAGEMIVNSRVNDLRSKHGYTVEHQTVKGTLGSQMGDLHQYRLTLSQGEQVPEFPSPVTAPSRVTLNRDSIPRDLKHRYRIYVLDEGNNLLLIGTAATEEQVGVKLCQLGREGQTDRGCVGLLDSFGKDTKTAKGKWLINPWNATLI